MKADPRFSDPFISVNNIIQIESLNNIQCQISIRTQITFEETKGKVNRSE